MRDAIIAAEVGGGGGAGIGMGCAGGGGGAETAPNINQIYVVAIK